MGFHICELPFKTFGIGDIVAIHARDVTSPGKRDALVEAGSEAERRLASEEPNSRIAGRGDNMRRVVARAVVENDEFPVGKGLGAD